MKARANSNNADHALDHRRRLVLLRHAKSSWSDPHLRDFDRPLNDRGKRALALIGAYCRRIGLGPSLVICSPALRTRLTWAGISHWLREPEKINFTEGVYEASAEELSAILREIDDRHREIMLIGHNPGLHDLAMRLSNEGGLANPEAVGKLRSRFPTCALAVFGLETRSWSTLDAGKIQMEDFVTPKQLV